MKTALVVVAVTAYGLAAGATGLVIGVYLGWTRRRTIDRWQLEDADKVISQAIDDRQTAINQTAIADALLAQFTARYTTQIDDELQQLLDEER